MNRPRAYAKNNTGISISIGYGQINIAKMCIETLGKPRTITFARINSSFDWMHLIPDCKNPPEGSVTKTVQYRNREKKTGAYIASQELVRSIFVAFYISRKDPFVYAPFYIVRKDNYDGQPCVKVCMNFFKENQYEEQCKTE